MQGALLHSTGQTSLVGLFNKETDQLTAAPQHVWLWIWGQQDEAGNSSLYGTIVKQYQHEQDYREEEMVVRRAEQQREEEPGAKWRNDESYYAWKNSSSAVLPSQLEY